MKSHFVTLMCLFALVVLGGMSPARAYGVDRLVEGAKLCTQQLPRNERKYGIPLHLLSAIASTESGRWHDGLNMALPWPWTINAEGKGYYFDSKQEAIAFATKLRARGVKSFDVGCMQVNMMHHPHAFASLQEAFEPAANVEYAAKFLRSNFEEEKSWRKAAAAYHSRTPEFGNPYIAQVYKSWQRIVERVRGSRLGAGTQTAALAQEFSRIEPAAAPSGTTKIHPGYKPIQMRLIKVRSTDGTTASMENGVRVVRPQIALADPATRLPVETAYNDASFVSSTIPAPEPVVQPHIVRVNDELPAPTAARPAPKFIFN